MPDYQKFRGLLKVAIDEAKTVEYLDAMLDANKTQIADTFKLYAEKRETYDKYVEARRRALGSPSETGGE